jgi:spermidine synthase
MPDASAAITNPRSSVPPMALMAACFFLSGCLALCYEIGWIRKASMAFGATTFALSTVLAVSFAGLAAGSYLMGRWSSSIRRPLRAYAALEIGVGLLALLSPLAFRLGDVVFGWAYPLVWQSFWLLSALRLLLVALILFPPSLLIGATFPLFCRQYVVETGRISRTVGLLYGINTLGAALGCALCGIVLIPTLGVNASIYLAGAINLMLGLLVWHWTRHAPPLPATRTKATAAPAAPSGPATGVHRLVPVLFFLVGFVALGSEVVWTRYLSLLMRNTVYTYTLTLFVVLIGIVLGSLLTAWLFDRLQRRALVFGGVQMGYGLIVLAVLLLPPGIWQAWLDTTNPIEQFGIAALVLLVPAMLSGVSFPLAIRMVVGDPEMAGAGVGRMTALNTFGGILGSLAVGFLVLPLAGLQMTLLIMTGISLAVGATALSLEATVARRARLAAIAGGGVLWLAIPLLLGTELPGDFLAQKGRLVDYREGLGSELAVVQKDAVRQLQIDRLWQGEDRKTHQIAAAHVPMQFHPGARDLAVIGLGVGQTASRFLMYDIERLDCIDIEARLIPLVRAHFDSRWMDDPRVRFIIEDGRNYLAHTDARYDLISVEVGQVFRPGIASFYTVEFYRQARERLRDNGLISQFVPIGFFRPDELRTVLATFRAVFPQNVLWYNRGELLLLGTTGEQLRLDAAALAQRLDADPQLRNDLRFAYWGGPAHYLNQPEVFLGGFLAGPDGVARLAGDAPVYRDDRPHLEYSVSTGTSHTSLVTIVDEIGRAVEPFSAVLQHEPDGDTVAVASAIRRRNLGNIVAAALQKEVQLSSAEGRQQAGELLAEALAWNPDNASLQMMVGNLHHFAGRLDEAAAAYRRALVIDPDYAKAYTNLGNAYAAMGRLPDAVAQFRKTLHLQPQDPHAHNALGRALAAAGDLDEAIRQFEEGLSIAPQDPQLRANLALVLEQRSAGHTRPSHR